MEEWQEIKEVSVNKYFVGKAFVKYRADLHVPKSDISVDQHFRLSAFYDIKISDIKQIDESTFQKYKVKSVFDLNAKQGDIVGEHNKEFYALQIDDIFIKKLSPVTQEQVEGNELHGYFEKIEVVFQMHRTEERIVNKATTVVPEMKSTTAPDLSVDVNQKPEIHSDHLIIADPPGIGCLSILGYLLVGIFFLLQIAVFLSSGQWLLMLIFFIGYGIILGLIWLFSFLNRYLERLLPGIRLLNWGLSLGLFIALLIGFSSIFDNRNWQWRYEETKVEDKNEVQQTNFVPDPNPNRTKSTSPIEVNDTLAEKVNVYLKWKGFDGEYYEGSYFLYKNDVQQSSNYLFQQSLLPQSGYADVYNTIYYNDRDQMNDVFRMLDSIQVENDQNKFEFAQTIVSMVQSIKYVLILNEGCEDPGISLRSGIGNGLKTECQGFRPFGLKTPLEFLADLKGDCDSRTLLLYTILKHYEYDVAIINSEYYLHSMLGLSLNSDRLGGAYKVKKGKKYFYWETTDKGFKLGELPNEIGNLNYWNIVLN